MLVSPPFFEPPHVADPAQEAQSRIFIRSIGQPYYHDNYGPYDPISLSAANAYTSPEPGDMLVAFSWPAGDLGGTDSAIWNELGPAANSMVRWRISNPSDPNGDDFNYPGFINDEGSNAIFGTQIIAIADRQGGTVELIDSDFNWLPGYTPPGPNITTVPGLGVGPNPIDTFVIGYWEATGTGTQPDSHPWDPDGLGKGGAYQSQSGFGQLQRLHHWNGYPLANSANTWSGSTSYSQYDTIVGSATASYPVVFTALGPGTSGASEPSWDFVIGNKTFDGSIVWETTALTGDALPPSHILGYPWTGLPGFYYFWAGWGFEAQAVSTAVSGGTVSEFPNRALIFNTFPSAGMLRFGIAP